jgi:hypothetical protein
VLRWQEAVVRSPGPLFSAVSAVYCKIWPTASTYHGTPKSGEQFFHSALTSLEHLKKIDIPTLVMLGTIPDRAFSERWSPLLQAGQRCATQYLPRFSTRYADHPCGQAQSGPACLHTIAARYPKRAAASSSFPRLNGDYPLGTKWMGQGYSMGHALCCSYGYSHFQAAILHGLFHRFFRGRDFMKWNEEDRRLVISRLARLRA